MTLCLGMSTIAAGNEAAFDRVPAPRYRNMDG